MNPLGGGAARRGRSGRAAKQPVDPWRPLGWSWEEERIPGDRLLRVLTVFLAGAECRFACVFCDLWQHTLDGATPAGAVPTQLRAALRAAGPVPAGAAIKLYNASNFFDRRAVPPVDDPAIAEIVAPFERVTVECHPRLVGPRCIEFARRVPGQLEIGMGLETIHPEALPRLNKGMTLADFDRAAGRLRSAGIAIRAFVLLSAPFVPPQEAVTWTVSSARYAIDHGATHVSLIPTRGGNGALEAIAREGAFTPPSLAQLEDALDGAVGFGAGGAVVTADLWDVDRLASCADCYLPRVNRLARLNLTGRPEPRVQCATCQER